MRNFTLLGLGNKRDLGIQWTNVTGLDEARDAILEIFYSEVWPSREYRLLMADVEDFANIFPKPLVTKDAAGAITLNTKAVGCNE